MFKLTSLAFVSIFLPSAFAAIGSDGYCRADNCDAAATECTFTVKVHLMAGELGYYQFEECGEITNPTIAMEMGKTYRFVQADRSNWYHPLGLAYYADGAHDDVDELEPGIAPPGSTDASCANEMSCPAPMYFKAGSYLGTYSNDATILAPTTGEDNFGLDDYEPLFFHPPLDWVGYGQFDVTLKFPETDGFVGDIFYFCHIHQFMTGRIKLLKNDVAIAEEHSPQIPYAYDSPSDYDMECGTFGLEDFQLDHPECPEKFVCNVPGDNAELAKFSDCIDSMNCHMFAGMTTNVNAGSGIALFIHQMIPHHQNAVNMAKALLKTGLLDCDDLTEESDDCALEIILREIINAQNHQIQNMRGILEATYPEYPTDDCKVEIMKPADKSVSTDAPKVEPSGESAGSFSNTATLAGLGAAGAVFAAL